MLKQSFLFLLIIVAFSLFPRLTHAEEGDGPKFYPIDEAIQDSSFYAFRETLICAVEKRDYNFIHGVLAENVRVNYDGPQGIEAFKNKFGLANAGSKYWKELEIILSNGGSFEQWIDGEQTNQWASLILPTICR